MNYLRQREAGFTLAELLVAVVIMGILATIAASSFQSLTQSQRVKNASFELFSSLSLARSEAIKRNSDVTLASVAYANDEFGWVITAASGETIRTQGQIKGVVWTIFPTGTTGITYQRTGRATASPSFQIDASTTPTENVRCIRIDLSGMPRVTKGACT